MIFISATSQDNWRAYQLGDICNLTITNDSATNVLSVGSNGQVTDLAELFAGESQTFLNISLRELYIKSKVAGQSVNFRVNGWS